MKPTIQRQLGIAAETVGLSRRELLARVGLFGVGAVVESSPMRLLAAEMATLAVAYAGSMGSVMEGPVKRAVAESLQLELHGQAQGASALAQLIVGGSLRPDAFVSITPGPMLNVLRAGKAAVAQPIAATEMVIAYSPRSRFAPQLEAAAQGRANWWKVLQQPGFRFGRTDPAADPQGRNIVFTMMLAAKEYKQPDLVEKILGPLVNPQQINMESSVQARMQAGELDAASAYKIQPGPFHLPYIALPKSINLSGSTVHAEHPEVKLTIGGKTYVPEPLIFYAAALQEAANARGAAAFTAWLEGAEAQGILREYGYDAAGSAPILRASDVLHG